MLDGREIQTLFRAASLRTLMAGAARVLGGLKPGHASIKITVDTYGHPRQGTSLALADTLDSPGGETVRYATVTQLTSVE